MRRFVLRRVYDVSGISGTGVVVEGVMFTDGHVAMRWLTPDASTVIWDDIEKVVRVHGHGGATELEWID